jgi:hypothetical protein
VIPWERFRTTVAEAEALTRPDEFDAYQMLGEHYAGVRRWVPAFLEAFAFQSAPAAAALMRAIEALREMNRMTTPSLPKSAPTSFVRQRWARHVLSPAASSTGVITNSVCCRSCVTGCASAMCG